MNEITDFTSFAQRLLDKREIHSCNSSLRNAAVEYMNELIDLMFPHFSNKIYYSSKDITAKIQLLQRSLISLLEIIKDDTDVDAKIISAKFMSLIPGIHEELWTDAEFILKGDPAAENIDEVILAYPGFFAIMIYRIAHELYNLKVPLIPRILTEYAHEKTGIDIHPGAAISSPFFIDHGTGIVIGETTVIGKNVKLYQGVTLGALSVEKIMASSKRHPTIEDDVVVYAQAVILGGKTVIGKNSIIGGNSWITQSIPPGSVVSSKSEVRVKSNDQYFDTIDFII